MTINPSANDIIHALEQALRSGGGPPDLAQLTARADGLAKVQGDPALVNDWEFFDLIHRANRTFTQLGGGIVGIAGLNSPYTSSRLIRQAHETHIAARYPEVPSRFVPRPPTGRLRVGFVGADFFWQATALLMIGVVEQLDRAAFEVFAYDFGGGGPSPYRDRSVAAFDRFADIRALTDDEAAQRIHDDGIDVLIHLRGVIDTRLGIFAQRPAPVQVQYLYYPCTSGAWFMDYMIADDIVVPPEQEPFYTEKIVRLSGCYQPNDNRRALPPARDRDSFGLPPDAVVMANFGQPAKITPDVFDVWAALLRSDSRRILWLLKFPDAPAHEANLRREGALRGVDQSKLIFAPFDDYPVHLARLARADLVLDTFPCGGHTVTSDALWAATPVLTLKGEIFASRVAASLIHATGLDNFITTNLEDYAQRAEALLAGPDQLNRARKHLEAGRTTFDLFNTALYANRFGELLNGIARRDLLG